MIIHFHGNHNLGDIMFNFIIFYNIKDYLESIDCTIYFYMRNELIEQMNDFKPVKNMMIFDISKKPNDSIELWDCNDYIFEPGRVKNKYSKLFSGMSQNNYYVYYFNEKLQKLNIPVKINHFCYEDNDLIERYNNLDNKYKNIDILIINSLPLSGQYYYDENKWSFAIQELNNIFKIVTTKKVNNVLCTRDNNLRLKDIAAINTGPLTALLNKITLQNVKKFYIFDNRTYLNYPNFESKKKLKDISLDELKSYIN